MKSGPFIFGVGKELLIEMIKRCSLALSLRSLKPQRPSWTTYGRLSFVRLCAYGILVPYLVFFFGAILLMGLPMFRINRLLWLVTVATTVLLLGSMSVATFKGVG